MTSGVLSGLRILHVHTLPVISGSGINTFLTMKGSQAQGAEVGLACALGGRLEAEVRAAGMDFHPIPGFVSQAAPLKDLRAFWHLSRLMRRRPFDIVHTHNSKGGFLGRLAAWRNGVPVIIHTVHGFSFHEQANIFSRPLFIQLERIAARRCHRMIAISQPLIEWAVRERIAARERFVKIHSGIEIERFRNPARAAEVKAAFQIDPETVVLGLVSKLWEGKGHTVLFEALHRMRRQCPHIRLLVVGEGYLENHLRRQVKSLGLDDLVDFTGFRRDIPEITSILDIAVLPSFFEGMGRVVLEAMAAGKPVVASRVGGLPELVDDGVTGFLVEAGDVANLTARLHLLVDNPALRREMGRAGARKVFREHSAEHMIEKIHELYQEEVANRLPETVVSQGGKILAGNHR